MLYGTNDDVRRIKERIDIVEVIGDRVQLRRFGRNYVGLCPFHNEKTPSFYVSPERQSYHCFGCNRGGDIFSFVMETEGIDFRECLELLAARVGIELSCKSSYGRDISSKVSSLYQVMNLAARFFSEELRSAEGAAGVGYMQRRSLTRQDGERFGLGWSPNSWDGLLRYLRENQVPDKLALESGLVLTSQRGSLYDRFRGRLMFPIKDVTGRVIAFGGRLVDGEGAKYINSPEGKIYSKRRNLYLLHEARASIREKKRVILVEGYMDALRLHLNGFSETVASLGTSLTEEQAHLLKRFSDQCYICYDSDTAGQEATLRSMYILQKLGLDVHVINLPSGKDPDELLVNSKSDTKVEPSKIFEHAIAEARPLFLQHLYVVQGLLNTPETRKAGRDSLMAGLMQSDRSAISPYLSFLAGALGLSPEAFWRELEDFRRNRKPRVDYRNQNPMQNNERFNNLLDPAEAALCALLWQNNNRDNCRQDQQARMSILALLSNERAKELAVAIMMEPREILSSRWHDLNESWPLAVIANGDAFIDKLITVETDSIDPWQIVCETLRQKQNRMRYTEIQEKIRRGMVTPDEVASLQVVTT